MSFFRSLFIRYQKFCETTENHRDEELKTKYFKASANQVMQTAERLLQEDPSCKVTSISKEHGEIAAEIRKGTPVFITVTIISVKPFQTAVDLHVSTEKLSIAGGYPSLKKEVLRFYKKMEQNHPYIGSGLHASE